MKFLKQNISSIFSLLILFIVVFFMLGGSFSSTKSICEKEKATIFKGVVDSIMENPGPTKLIHLSNGQIINPSFTYGLWIKVKVGDSIIKEPGNLNYKIYDRNGYLDTILKWDQMCQ